VACFPAARERSSTSLDADGLHLCWNTDRDAETAPANTCLRVGRDGTAQLEPPRPGPPTAPAASAPASNAPRATVSGDRTTVEACDGRGPCRTVAPKLAKGVEVQATVVDPAGGLAALLLQESCGAGVVELYQLSTGKLRAKAKRPWTDHHCVRYEIAFVGPLLLWIVHPGATEAAEGSLWRVDATKLTRVGELPGRTAAWGEVAPGTFAFATSHGGEGDVVQLWDVQHAKLQASFPIEHLGLDLDDDERNTAVETSAASTLVTRPGELGFVAHTARAARAIFVDVASHKQTEVAIPLCPKR